MDEMDRVLREHQAHQSLLTQAERPPDSLPNDEVSDLRPDSILRALDDAKERKHQEMVEAHRDLYAQIRPRVRSTTRQPLQVSLQTSQDGVRWRDVKPGGTILVSDPERQIRAIVDCLQETNDIVGQMLTYGAPDGEKPIDPPGTHRERRLWYE